MFIKHLSIIILTKSQKGDKISSTTWSLYMEMCSKCIHHLLRLEAEIPTAQSQDTPEPSETLQLVTTVNKVAGKDNLRKSTLSVFLNMKSNWKRKYKKTRLTRASKTMKFLRCLQSVCPPEHWSTKWLEGLNMSLDCKNLHHEDANLPYNDPQSHCNSTQTLQHFF